MTRIELEWKLVYALVVAGKSARFTNAAVARLRDLVGEAFPIQTIALDPKLLEVARTGRYGLIKRAIARVYLLGDLLDLRTCSPADLERIPGIGPKTARFFVVWTRPDAEFAVLDVHVLRWMRVNGWRNVPNATPTGRRYAELERAFLEEAGRRGQTPRELDLEIWSAAASAPNLTGG